MSTPKGAVKDRRIILGELRETDHVFAAVAAELGIDPDRLLAEIADATSEPFVWERS